MKKWNKILLKNYILQKVEKLNIIEYFNDLSTMLMGPLKEIDEMYLLEK